MNPNKQMIRVVVSDLTVTDVEADTIGGAEGELALFQGEKLVALFALGMWMSATLLPPPEPVRVLS